MQVIVVVSSVTSARVEHCAVCVRLCKVVMVQLCGVCVCVACSVQCRCAVAHGSVEVDHVCACVGLR